MIYECINFDMWGGDLSRVFGHVVQLVKQQIYIIHSLMLQSDNNKNTQNINGVAHEESTDIIYFTDANKWHNTSKIKPLNMKTRQVADVFNTYVRFSRIICKHIIEFT